VKPLTRVQRVWYAFVRGLIAGFCRLFWRLEITGAENIPTTGPFILSPVHRSNIDTPLVCALTTRPLRYMGKREMWKYGWSAWFFTSLGGFPVDRGHADREALRSCAEVLNLGDPLVLFPEGTRQSGPMVDELFDGAAYVALKTGAPIVPVGIGGSEAAMPKGARMIRPVKVRLVVGEPLEPKRSDDGGRASRRAVRELTEELKERLQSLFDQAQRG
jgi:1-acyl-sn-glycerol-3-phosphate acyltransferase